MVCRPHTGQLIVHEFAQDNFVHKDNTLHRMTYYVYFARHSTIQRATATL